MRLLGFAITLLALVLAAAAPASAMNFKSVTTKSGLRLVIASGEIKSGDARRLARALQRAGRTEHGTKMLLLNSPGGQVAEAILMSALINEIGVTTVVAKGAICASACASVLFVSGRYRTVETGGALGIHSCYDSRNGRAASECNAAISAHAENFGVSGSTLMALQEVAGSQSMIIFNTEEAACFGLTRQPGARASRKTPPCITQLQRGSR